MKASPWQTLLLAGIGAAVPYLSKWVHDPGLLAVISALVVAGSNILRSPIENPPTAIKASDPSQLTEKR